MKQVRLTPGILRRIIKEEKAKITREAKEADSMIGDDPEEIEAGDYADTLAHDVDHIKAAEITLEKLQRKARILRRKIAEAKKTAK